jgi:hypothetical protein
MDGVKIESRKERYARYERERMGRVERFSFTLSHDEAARFRACLLATGRKCSPWVQTLVMTAVAAEEAKTGVA